MLQALPGLFDLLWLPFLACVAMTAILGFLGLHVIRREIVFVDIAMAQIVAVGAVGAHLLFEAHDDSFLAYASAFGLSVLAAAFFAFTRRRVLEISSETVIGVSYAIAAAAALFLLGIAPGGHVHAQHMLSGSILWVTWPDLVLHGLAFSAVGVCFYLLRKPFEKLSTDYEGAIRDGINVVGWDFLFYTLIGVVITFAVRIGGVVVVFCLLIIPATIAVIFAKTLRARLLIAWTAGLSGSFLGLLFAERLDFSVGPAVALLLGVGLAVAALWYRLKAAQAAALTVAVVAAYVVLLTLAPAAGPSRARRNSPADRGALETDPEPAQERGAPAPVSEDPQARCESVLEAIGQNAGSGVASALKYLEEDPPIFFRQRVVDRLNEVLKEPFDFDAMRPFADPDNREAVKALERRFGSGASSSLLGASRALSETCGSEFAS